MNEALAARISDWQRMAWITGGAGFAAWLLGSIFARTTAFQAYWFAWVFWVGLALGALSMLMLQFLTGGAWGVAIQRPAEAAALTLPIMALLMVPAFFGLGHIFIWARPETLAADWPHKRQYLTVPWFAVRAVVYLAVLIPFPILLRRCGDPAVQRRLSAIGILTYAACTLFASTDWIMSLEPQWYSTMLVVITMASQFLAALALTGVVVTTLSRQDPMLRLLTPKHLHDLGNLLLAFVTFWIYVSFAQYLIIWSGDLPREISWYLHRSSGGWQFVALVLAVTQFALPFALLLSRAAKRHHRRLLPIACLVFGASAINVFWLITPTFSPRAVRAQWLDLAAFAGLGGIWMGAFLGFLKRQPLVAPIVSAEVAHD